MKPAQAPIYRAVERLLLWLVPVTERLPKSLPYQTIGADILRDVKLCLDAVIAAIASPNAKERLDCIDVLIARMTAVKSAVRILAECRIKNAPVLSYKHLAGFLDLANTIATQAAAWKKATSKQVSNHD